MEAQSNSHPPLIPSQLSAKRSAEQWNDQRSRKIKDKDGLEWRLHIFSEQAGSESEPKFIDWTLKIQLKASANTSTLIETKTLDKHSDSRLIKILDHHKIEFALKPLKYNASNEEEVYRMANEGMLNYIDRIKNTSLHQIKRELIGRFVDQRCQFSKT